LIWPFFLIKFDFSKAYFIANSLAPTLIIGFGLNLLKCPFWFKKTKNTWLTLWNRMIIDWQKSKFKGTKRKLNCFKI
jgi:hypothetical protein